MHKFKCKSGSKGNRLKLPGFPCKINPIDYFLVCLLLPFPVIDTVVTMSNLIGDPHMQPHPQYCTHTHTHTHIHGPTPTQSDRRHAFATFLAMGIGCAILGWAAGVTASSLYTATPVSTHRA